MSAVYGCFIGYGVSIVATITTGSFIWGLLALACILAFAHYEKKENT